jgi:uncharacterized protein YdeI (YjbR/CyaY-like superfamily)
MRSNKRMPTTTPKPTFFSTPALFRAWLKKHHKSESELIVGFYKVKSGKPSITWPESVDEALCVGWIDAIRRGIDDESYSIRFTKRKPKCICSAVNIKRAKELIDLGRMTPDGLAAFELRDEKRTNRYSFEQPRPIELTEEQLKQFKSNKTAWMYFESKPASYRKPAIWWVVSAKREETRVKRLATLIADCEAGRLIKPLSY